MPARTAPDRAAGETAQRTARAAYTALGWVVLFFAFHVYWYLGGSFACPGKLSGGPHTLLAWIFDVFIDAAFPLGALVCLAIARGWARGRLALPGAALVWAGCALLAASAALSMAAGDMFFPAALMISSFLRPVIVTYPSSSVAARSPVSSRPPGSVRDGAACG